MLNGTVELYTNLGTIIQIFAGLCIFNCVQFSAVIQIQNVLGLIFWTHCIIEVDQNFGFGAKTGNNDSFGVVSFSVQKTQLSFVYSRNCRRFWCLLTEIHTCRKQGRI